MHPAVVAYESAYETSNESDIGALVAEAFSEDGRLEPPWIPEPIAGHEALTNHIRRTRERIAETTQRHTSPMERVGQTLRWTWAFEVDGAVVAEGMDVVVLSDDERIQRLVVFDGIVPADQATPA